MLNPKFKIGDVVTVQIVGNTNPRDRNKHHYQIIDIENGRYVLNNGWKELPDRLSKSKFQDKLKQKYGWH